MNKPTIDSFPCILIATDLHTNKLKYCNQYTLELFTINANDMHEYNLFDFISKASAIFFESYIKPTIVNSGACQEIQISLRLSSLEKVAAVANVQLTDSTLFWSIYIAVARDRLYQELLSAREHLESETEKLTLLTRVDPLTNLLNRRAAIDDFTNIIHQLNRNFVPTSFLLIDIDWFKKINDSFGHDRGDEVLVEFSETLKSITRSSDIVSRWGGEEFLVILYNSSAQNTLLFTERLHKKINKITLSKDKQLSVSIGGSTLKVDQLSCDNIIEKYIKQADLALYEAKIKGRSRTVFFDNLHIDSL